MKRAAFLAILAWSAPAGADAATSEWQDMGGGRARLLAQFDPASRRIDAVVEIELKDGWKTYWREPGAAGVPPQFDFSRSRNVTAAPPAFPFPELIRVKGVEFAGYRKRVLFPFAATAAPGGVLALDLLAGLCEEICIPATASFSLEVASMQSSDAIAARAAGEARRALPGAASADFGVTAADLGDGAIEVRTAIAADGPDPALFVEGPAEWRLVPARLLVREGAWARFAVDLDASVTGSDVSAAKLRATLTQGARGVEQEFFVAR